MSQASKCDVCDALFEPTPGVLSLDARVKSADGDTWNTWSEIDLCETCTAKVLPAIRPALNDFDEAMKG